MTIRSSQGTVMTLPFESEGPVISRFFRGRPEQTSQDAAEFLAAISGEWTEVNRAYVPGSYGCGAFLIALVLCLVLVGIFIFIYMVLVKPPGTLTVTYTKKEPPVVA